MSESVPGFGRGPRAQQSRDNAERAAAGERPRSEPIPDKEFDRIMDSQFERLDGAFRRLADGDSGPRSEPLREKDRQAIDLWMTGKTFKFPITALRRLLAAHDYWKAMAERE